MKRGKERASCGAGRCCIIFPVQNAGNGGRVGLPANVSHSDAGGGCPKVKKAVVLSLVRQGKSLCVSVFCIYHRSIEHLCLVDRKCVLG